MKVNYTSPQSGYTNIMVTISNTLHHRPCKLLANHTNRYITMFLICNFKPHFISFSMVITLWLELCLLLSLYVPSLAARYTLCHYIYVLAAATQKMHDQIDLNLCLLDTNHTFVAHRMEELQGDSSSHPDTA